MAYICSDLGYGFFLQCVATEGQCRAYQLKLPRTEDEWSRKVDEQELKNPGWEEYISDTVFGSFLKNFFKN